MPCVFDTQGVTRRAAKLDETPELYLDLCVFVWNICRKGLLDPKKPANRYAGYPGQAMQFLAEGHKKLK